MALPFTPAEIVASAIGTINACRTVAELDSAIGTLMYDTTDWSGAMVAAVTDAFEAKKAHLSVEAPQTPADRSFDDEYVARKRAELVAKAPQTPRPFTDEMVAKYPACQAVALAYVRNYKGFNSFVQSLAVGLADYGRLTVPQMRGALNVMVVEDRKAAAPKPAPQAFTINFAEVQAPVETRLEEAVKPVDVSDGPHYTPETITPVVPNGTYTVPINDHGEYRVIRLEDCPEKFNKPAGTQIAAYQSGASNETDFTGFAFVTGDTLALWRKFRNARDLQFALVKLITTGRHAEFGKLWAMESKRCFICGRKLTVPISKLAGIGPKCAENTGIDIDALAALNSAEETRKERAKAQADIDELFPE